MTETAARFRFAGAAILAGIAIDLSMADTVRAQETVFEIRAFQVEGNTVFPGDEITRVLEPFIGPQRRYQDIHDAMRALESLYLRSGYGTVQVNIPEQEVSGGTVRFRVRETTFGSITVAIAGPPDAFSERNVRDSLPRLRENAVPNTIGIAADVQLANENPSKKVEVTLKQGAQPDTIDAVVAVTATDPKKIFAMLDNTGNAKTGRYRLGIGFQHANVFDSDQTLTAMLQTSPDDTSKVRVYTLSYRVPLYRYGDSIDLVGGLSSVDAGTTQTIAGPLQVSGRGKFVSARYNQLLRRRGEYTHQLVYGWDVREYDNACSLGGFGAAGCGPGGASVTVRPASIGYAARLTRSGIGGDMSFTAVRNLPGGPNGDETHFNAVRPAVLGGGGAPAIYTAYRLNASARYRLPKDWRVLASLGAQHTPDALVAAEQYGLTGALAVRGYEERELTRDVGYSMRADLQTPDVASYLKLNSDKLISELRVAVFADAGAGHDNPLAGESRQETRVSSVGLGMRWTAEQRVFLRLDAARAQRSAVSTRKGDDRVHLFVQISL